MFFSYISSCKTSFYLFLFFFNDTATTEIYTTVHTLSLHDDLPISRHADRGSLGLGLALGCAVRRGGLIAGRAERARDRQRSTGADDREGRDVRDEDRDRWNDR